MRPTLRTLTSSLSAFALSVLAAQPALAAKKPVKRELEELNAQVTALATAVANANTALDSISKQIAALQPPAPEAERVLELEVCTELGVGAELKLGTFAEGEAAGEGSAGIDAYGTGASVEGKARGKAEAGGEIKGSLDAVKVGVCFDVLAAARRIIAARAGVAAPLRPRGGASPVFDPSELAPAVQDYILALAQVDPNDLVNRAGGLAQFVSLEPGALADALDAFGAAGSEVDPIAILNGEGPLRGLAAALPLPPGVRAAVHDPGAIVDGLAEFRPCELTGLKPNLQGVIDGACALRPAWDPVEVVASFGNLGTVVTNVQTILSRSGTIQSIVTGVRNLLVNTCNGLDGILGFDLNCAL
jgi:hypothetical protein